MNKIISVYRSISAYPATARIIQVSEETYILCIVRDDVGPVCLGKGNLAFIKNLLFSFSPRGYKDRIICWEEVK